jgi:hypothetical protein
MDSKLLTLRCNILHQMNEYILLWGDENIIDVWILVFPDEATIEEVKEIAENENLWIECVDRFKYCCDLMGNFDED